MIRGPTSTAVRVFVFVELRAARRAGLEVIEACACRGVIDWINDDDLCKYVHPIQCRPGRGLQSSSVGSACRLAAHGFRSSGCARLGVLRPTLMGVKLPPAVLAGLCGTVLWCAVPLRIHSWNAGGVDVRTAH